MKLTLAVDEQTVERAREVARHQGTSLNALIREYIKQLAGHVTGEQVLAEFVKMWSEPAHAGSGKRFDREDVYAERLGRYKR